MEFLAGAATLAQRKVLFVVAAHLRREAGNVVAPASQNFPGDGIDALTHNAKLKGGYFRKARPARPASPGSARASFACLARFRPLARQFPDGYSVPTGAPILCMMHLHHSFPQKIRRVTGSRGD